MDIEELKEELTKRMAEAYSDYMEGPADGEYADGYASGCEYAIELLENLQEKKVVIPKFVADDIKYHKGRGETLRSTLGDVFGQYVESDVCYWFLLMMVMKMLESTLVLGTTVMTLKSQDVWSN